MEYSQQLEFGSITSKKIGIEIAEVSQKISDLEEEIEGIRGNNEKLIEKLRKELKQEESKANDLEKIVTTTETSINKMKFTMAAAAAQKNSGGSPRKLETEEQEEENAKEAENPKPTSPTQIKATGQNAGKRKSTIAPSTNTNNTNNATKSAKNAISNNNKSANNNNSTKTKTAEKDQAKKSTTTTKKPNPKTG